jgi:ParB family chromosome partitioning protein
MNDNSTNIDMPQEYRKIPIENIDTNGLQVRSMMNDDHVIELAGSMATLGLLQAIDVSETEKGKYKLEAGFHRLAGAVKIGWTEIYCHVLNHPGTPGRIIGMTENLIRKDMTLQEEIEAVNYLINVEKMSPSSICSLLNKGRAWVDFRIMAPNLPEEVKVKLYEGLISQAVAEEIGGITDEGARNTILNQAIYGRYTHSQIKDIINLYKQTPSMEDAIQKGIDTKKEIQTTSSIIRPCTLCGLMHEPQDLVYIAVCRQGCPKPQPK